jgi:hypothetical protein
MANPSNKPIRLSDHALGYVARRGFTVAEVEEAIRLSPWRPAREGRWETARDFPYNGLWNGTLYATKRLRPVFVETSSEIVVVTVYTYYF